MSAAAAATVVGATADDATPQTRDPYPLNEHASVKGELQPEVAHTVALTELKLLKY